MSSRLVGSSRPLWQQVTQKVKYSTQGESKYNPRFLVPERGKTIFSQLFQISTNCENIWQKDGKENKLMWDAVNFLTTYFALNKLKYCLFSRTIGLCNSSIQTCQNLCSKCVPHAQTKALRWRYWLIAASTIDWSNCAHSIRRVLSSSIPAILER